MVRRLATELSSYSSSRLTEAGSWVLILPSAEQYQLPSVVAKGRVPSRASEFGY